MKEPINKITLKDGSVRYRLVVDIGRDEHGRRKQLTRTFDTRREAREELSRTRHETNLGTYVKSSKETVNSYLDGYLQGATRGLRASTKRNYEDALRPVRERLGIRPLQSVTKSDVEDLVDWMLTAGRRRGGKPGTGLSGRSARLTLGRFSAALEAAVLEGKLVRNVARLVKPPEHTPRERETWSKAEVRKFLVKASSDRLYAAWRLSLYACAAVKFSACAGRISICGPGRSPSIRPGSWSSIGSASKSRSPATASGRCRSTAS